MLILEFILGGGGWGEKRRDLVNWLRDQTTLPRSYNNEHAINKPQEQITTVTWIETEVNSLAFSGLTFLKAHQKPKNNHTQEQRKHLESKVYTKPVPN